MNKEAHPLHPPRPIAPRNPKALPIINPSTRIEQPFPAKPILSKAIPPTQHTTTIFSRPNSAIPGLPIVNSPPQRRLSNLTSNTKVNENADLDEALSKPAVEHHFDVYALPFVPTALKVINTLAGTHQHTLPTRWIDFGLYVRGFVGSNMLEPLPPKIEVAGWEVISDTSDGITPSKYGKYFEYHLEAEIESQRMENELYSLYEHDVHVIADKDGRTLCSFSVPGLRENNPYVEEDDLVQLRQLLFDSSGRLYGMEEWLTPTNPYAGGVLGFSDLVGGQSRGEPAPGWTNVIHNSRISAVQRKQGLLTVTIVGSLAPPPIYPAIYQAHNSGVLHSKFNIRFPVSMARYFSMQQALSIVQKLLRSDNKHQAQLDEPGQTNITQSTLSSRALKSSCFPQLEYSSETWITSMLFPTESDCEVQTYLNPGFFRREFFDEQLNYEQKKATESVCMQNYGTLPFIISGPPGTGKTKTLVEIALQLLKNVDRVSHILICAPSDSAADVVLERLSLHLNDIELLRLNRPSRSINEVPWRVRLFSCISPDNTKFDFPPFRKLMSYQIVVTTCRDASLLLHARLTNSDLYTAEYSLRSAIHPYGPPITEAEMHWTALLIDESAQAIEPEALIPLVVVAPPMKPVTLASTPIVIIAGDEHQLGPRTSLRSSPLKKSLFARLFSRPVYADHPLARSKTGPALPALKSTMLPLNRPAFANLIRNYRSHPAILAVPSALFYADTLEPEATDTDRLAGWSEWRGRKWPVIFHNNSSDDDREMDGGGWFNIGEAHIACRYAASLVQSGLVKQNEVCIMTPFKAQVKYLRNIIRQEKYGSLWDVDIGPTEAFQGLEKGVVILCTTRSKQKYVNSDIEVDWGIIGLPNKMNVALTRAKFGLVVIGKEEILRRDVYWRAFLEFCDRNSLVSGMADADVTARNGQLTRLEKVLLANERGPADTRALMVVSQDDEMWTFGMQATLDVVEDTTLHDTDFDSDEESTESSC